MFIADNFKMELCFRRYIFGMNKWSTFLLGRLFILDRKLKIYQNGLTII
jgi:hypothetical protein